MSKHGVLLGAFHCCHMFRSQPPRVWAPATRQLLTTSNTEAGSFGAVTSARASARTGRDWKLNKCWGGRGGAVAHICLWIIAAVKSFNQSQNARIKKQEQFSDAPVVILIPDFSRKYELINVRQMDSAQRRWKIRRCLQSLLLCFVITDS